MPNFKQVVRHGDEAFQLMEAARIWPDLVDPFNVTVKMEIKYGPSVEVNDDVSLTTQVSKRKAFLPSFLPSRRTRRGLEGGGGGRGFCAVWALQGAGAPFSCVCRGLTPGGGGVGVARRQLWRLRRWSLTARATTR